MQLHSRRAMGRVRPKPTAISTAVAVLLLLDAIPARAACTVNLGVSANATANSVCTLSSTAPTTFTQGTGTGLRVFNSQGGGKLQVNEDHVLVNSNADGTGLRAAGANSAYNGVGVLTIRTLGANGVGMDATNGGSIANTNSVSIEGGANAVGARATGVTALIDIGGDFNAQMGNSTGDNAVGLRAQNGGTVVVRGDTDVKVQTSTSLFSGFDDDHGVVAQGTSGGASVTLKGRTQIEVTGLDSRGISAIQAATNQVVLEGDATIVVGGPASRGLHANDGALIRATAPLRIEHNGTTGIGSPATAVYATSSATGAGRVELADLTVTTANNGVNGVMAVNNGGTTGGSVQIGGRAAITVLNAQAVSASGTSSQVNIGSATIQANGANAVGLITSGNDSSIRINAVGAQVSSSIVADGNAVRMTGGSGQQITLDGAALASSGAATIAASSVQSAALTLTNGSATTASAQRLLDVINNSGLTFTSRASALSGDVVAAAGSTLDVRLLQGTRLSGRIESANLDTDSSSTWTLTGDSQIGILNHAGKVDFQAPSGAFVPRTLMVDTLNSQGGGMTLNTVLGNSASPTDRIVLTGTTTGTTALTIRNAGGSGNSTNDGEGIRVVDTQGAGSTAANSFALAAPVVAGAYEYLLHRGSASDANDWYLRSDLVPPPPPPPAPPPASAPPSSPPPLPTPAPDPAPLSIPAPAPVPDTGARLYRPAVAGYVMGASVQGELGASLMGRLHERVGEARPGAMEEQDAPSQAWIRAGGIDLSLGGDTRFSADSRQAYIQIGKDLHLTRDTQGGRTQTGITLAAGHADADFTDRLRPLAGLSQDTGSLRGDMLALGAYHTRYAADGGYLDLVGQVEHLRNRYQDSYGVEGRATGMGLGLSAEVGQPFGLGDSRWVIEPQAQLAWHRTELHDFNDGISAVAPDTQDLLRGRLGARAYRQIDPTQPRATRFWFGLDLLHDLKGSEARVLVAGQSVSEDWAATWGELGAGLQWSVAPGTEVYGHLKYQHILVGGQRDGWAGAIGLRTRW